MGFNGNSSEKAVVTEKKLYTGLQNMKVVMINPTKAELEAAGYKAETEPQYITTDENGVKKVRLDFFLQHKDLNIRTKVALFIENRLRLNKDGDKAEWINNYGKTAWGSKDAAPEVKWWDSKTGRVAMVGEGDLHLFLINWLNIAPSDEAKLDRFSALFNGDFSELKQLLRQFPNNEVRVLLAIREGKYQSVYPRYFDRATNKRTNFWESHIKNQTESGYPPKEDYQNSFNFQVWTEPTVKADVAEAVTAPGKTEDDPF